jgi:phosphate transport system permease protein
VSTDQLDLILPTPRRLNVVQRADVLDRMLALGLSFGIVGGIFVVTPLSGAVGMVACALPIFLALTATLARRRHGSVAAWNEVATAVVTGCAALTFAALTIIVWFVVEKGIHGLSRNFFTQTLEAVGPLDPPTVGGAKHAVIGTVEQVGLAALLATPLGVLTAIYLAEYQGRLTRLVRFFVDSMSGIPSVVAGLFVYTAWVVGVHQGFSGMAAAMALAILMLPTVARTAEEMLRLVPGSLREASYALGAPRWRTVLRVVLPTARAGVITSVVLGVARIAGETAPLLMTAFGTDAVNANPTKGAQSSLPLFVYSRVRNSMPSEIARGWAGALVLILIVLVLFTLARAIGSRTRKALR